MLAIDWTIFSAIFSLIFVAELPDKTAFATLLMSTKGRPVAVLCGVALAFFFLTLLAVVFGEIFAFFPERWVHRGAGILFLVFAYNSWKQKEDAEEEIKNELHFSKRTEFFKTLSKAFGVIFIAEWGDLTQIATASLAARYHDYLLTVFCAATLALCSVALIAILVGRKLKKVIPLKLLKTLSVFAFVLFGTYFVVESF